MKVTRAFAISTVAALGLSVGAMAQGWQPEFGMDRVGNDYRSFLTAKDDWKACQAACESDGVCQAWTLYTPQGGAASYCWMKNLAGEQKPSALAISGLRQTPAPAIGAAASADADSIARNSRAQRVPEEVVELHRPRFNLRKLSASEKAEVQQIGQRVRSGMTWPDFQRLQQLAETGDKQAMEFVYDALKDMPINRAFPFEVRDTKIESAPYIALASLWAAHIQAMHGLNTSKYRLACSSAPRALYGDCGYRMTNYSFSRQRADFAFVPVWGDEAFQRERINGIFQRMAQNIEPSNVEVVWLQKYSERHDLSAEFKAAEQARASLLQTIAANNARRRAQYVEQATATWTRLFGKQLDQKGASDLWWAAQGLGGDYLQRYESAYGRGGPPPLPGTNWSAAASAWLNPGEVNVRVVDNNGNYHDTTMSSFQAAIIGAKRN